MAFAGIGDACDGSFTAQSSQLMEKAHRCIVLDDGYRSSFKNLELVVTMYLATLFSKPFLLNQVSGL